MSGNEWEVDWDEEGEVSPQTLEHLEHLRPKETLDAKLSLLDYELEHLLILARRLEEDLTTVHLARFKINNPNAKIGLFREYHSLSKGLLSLKETYLATTRAQCRELLQDTGDLNPVRHVIERRKNARSVGEKCRKARADVYRGIVRVMGQKWVREREIEAEAEAADAPFADILRAGREGENTEGWARGKERNGSVDDPIEKLATAQQPASAGLAAANNQAPNPSAALRPLLPETKWKARIPSKAVNENDVRESLLRIQESMKQEVKRSGEAIAAFEQSTQTLGKASRKYDEFNSIVSDQTKTILTQLERDQHKHVLRIYGSLAVFMLVVLNVVVRRLFGLNVVVLCARIPWLVMDFVMMLIAGE